MIVFAFILFLVLNELILRVNETLGIVCYALIVLGVLIALSKKKEIDFYYRILTVLIILPVLRICTAFLELEEVWKVLLMYYLFLFLVVFYAFKFTKFEFFNFKRIWTLPIGLILIVGINLLFNYFISEKIEYTILFLSVIAVSEELYFRGLLQEVLMEKYGFYSVIVTSIIFVLFGLSFSWIYLMILFVNSLIIGSIYYYSRNLIVSILLNGIFNLMIYVIRF